MKKIIVGAMLPFLFILSSCYDDKGNYDYKEMPEVTFENLPAQINVLQNVESIELDPVVKSSQDGIIDAGNANFEFNCKISYVPSGSEEKWSDMNPDKKKSVSYVANLPAGSYTCWYSVTDKRTGIEYSAKVPVTVASISYEGWCVLCNEGDNNRVRLDIISVINDERHLVAHDILNSDFPAITNATQFVFDPWPGYALESYIYLLSETGSYKLDNKTLTATEGSNIFATDFALPLEEGIPVCYQSVSTAGYADAHLIVTTTGDVYSQNMGTAGPIFQMLMNTSLEGNPREYHVAPFIGTTLVRPNNGGGALLYDTDNKRFVGWHVNSTNPTVCFQLIDPINPLFSFQTGKDIVAMESTSFSNGMVYSVLQDADGKRSIYGINMVGDGFVQESYKETITAEGFNEATQYAFHSQYPYMFYSVGNKIYVYNLGTNQLMNTITLDGEDVTLLKFCLYAMPNPETFYADKSEEFTNRQYNLVVGSYKRGATDVNGGMLRFYKFNAQDASLTMLKEYDGFAKIKDVTYRERY